MLFDSKRRKCNMTEISWKIIKYRVFTYKEHFFSYSLEGAIFHQFWWNSGYLILIPVHFTHMSFEFPTKHLNDLLHPRLASKFSWVKSKLIHYFPIFDKFACQNESKTQMCHTIHNWSWKLDHSSKICVFLSFWYANLSKFRK